MNDAKTNELPECCQKKQTKSDKGFIAGLIYGLVPHIFCILFIVFSIIGATAGAAFFRQFLLVSNIFFLMIMLSFVFATISAGLYLWRNKRLSLTGIRKSWKYLSLLYGSTAIVSVLFIYVVFPMVTNINMNKRAESTPVSSIEKKLLISVDIPCSGHAPLIKSELSNVSGIGDIKFELPNRFTINYDPTKTNPKEIVGLSIFKTYKAKIL